MLPVVKSYLVRAFSFKQAVSLFLCPCLCVVCVTCEKRTQCRNLISLFSSPVLTVNLESGIGCVPCQPTKCYDPCVALTMLTWKACRENCGVNIWSPSLQRRRRPGTSVALPGEHIFLCSQCMRRCIVWFPGFSSQVMLHLPEWLFG